MKRHQLLALEIPALPEAAIRRLAEANLQDRADVIDAIGGHVGGGPAFAQWLGVRAKDLLAAMGLNAWPSGGGVRLGTTRALNGVPGAPTRRRSFQAASAAPRLPDHVSLLDRFGPSRDQGAFGACVGFTLAAMVEGQLGRPDLDLSEAFVYSLAKRIDGFEGDGTWIEYASRIVVSNGICREATFPYRPDRDYLTKFPPEAAFAEARNLRAESRTALDPNDVSGIRAELAAGRPVGISVPIFESTFRSLNFHAKGLFRMRLGEADPIGGGHAMCAAGYVTDEWLSRNGFDTQPGGGAIVVRNSWGHWAPENAVAAKLGAAGGYGLLPFDYMRQYGWEAYVAPVPRSNSRGLMNRGFETWWNRTTSRVAGAARARLHAITEDGDAR